MPSPIHKAIIKVISKGLEHLDLVLQDFIAGDLLSSDTHTNLTINGDSVKCIPDILHVVTALTDPPILTTPVMGKVAVHERIPYSPPIQLSHAWQKLQKEDNLRFYTTFLSNSTGSRSLNKPTEIVVEQHLWHAMLSVHFQVWVQDNNGQIDIETQNPDFTTCGELFLNTSMGNVMLMIERGLSQMRDQYVHLAQQASQNVDVLALLEVPVTLPFGWDGMLSKLALASMLMAYDRYKSWYSMVTGSRGVKRTADEAFNSGPARNTRSCTHARTAALAQSQSVP
ncbi:uncharacterized protein EDB91DRAFT_1243528 [Suillus paluster]|uniref:uncharacterized protein n=1 Tax=Suillus paluster TaxID=48578 RepID=UPI001B863F76|nr:uncharacterized protein EDB91DRAFT_1243528 [Suillus paluster]KAG1751261.1 hypothetical protein EDB91DRAFT_1243528 [Suillus paluster]